MHRRVEVHWDRALHTAAQVQLEKSGDKTMSASSHLSRNPVDVSGESLHHETLPTCPLYFLAPVIKLGSHLFSPAVPGRQKVRKTKPRGSINPALPPLTHSGSSETPRNAFLNVLRSTPSVPPSRLMAHLGLRAQSRGLWSRHGFAARLHPVEGVLACGGDPPRVPQTGGLNNRHLLSQF